MDEVTQQNASLVEEATAAAQSLLEQASALADAVSVFKLDEHHLKQTDNVISMHRIAKLPTNIPQQHLHKIRAADAVNGHWDSF
jgi:methyl-accepting chemotaxis protein